MKMSLIALALSSLFFSCGSDSSNSGTGNNVGQVVSGSQAKNLRDEIAEGWKTWKAKEGSIHTVIKPGGEEMISWSVGENAQETCHILFASQSHTYEQLTAEEKTVTREYIDPTLGPQTTAKPEKCQEYFQKEDPNIEVGEALAAVILISLDELPEETLKEMGFESVELARIETRDLQGHKLYTLYFQVKGAFQGQLPLDAIIDEEVEIEGELSISVTTQKVASGWLWYAGFKGIAGGKPFDDSARQTYQYDNFVIPEK